MFYPFWGSLEFSVAFASRVDARFLYRKRTIDTTNNSAAQRPKIRSPGITDADFTKSSRTSNPTAVMPENSAIKNKALGARWEKFSLFTEVKGGLTAHRSNTTAENRKSGRKTQAWGMMIYQVRAAEDTGNRGIKKTHQAMNAMAENRSLILFISDVEALKA